MTNRGVQPKVLSSRKISEVANKIFSTVAKVENKVKQYAPGKGSAGALAYKAAVKGENGV